MTKALRNIIKREFKRIGERKTLYLLMIILPIVFFMFYPLIYEKEIVRELPVAIWDADNSDISRKIIEMVESAPSMRIVKYDLSLEEIKQDFLAGKIQGAFCFPKDMEKNVKAGKNSSVVIYKNTANLIIGNTILKDGTAIVRTASAGVLLKKLRAKGMINEQAMNIINPVRIETQSLYNPNYSYLNYLVPGTIAFSFQMLIMIAAVIVISSEFTHETFPELLETANDNLWLILLGKAIPHFLINSASSLLIAGIVFPIFNFKIYGSVIVLILFFLLFVLACLMLGLLISSIFHDQLFATELAVFINTPAFIFSGFTFPIWAMPFIHSAFAKALPFTHFLTGFLEIYQMNAPVKNLYGEVLILSGFVVGSCILTYFAMAHQVNKYYKKKIKFNGSNA